VKSVTTPSKKIFYFAGLIIFLVSFFSGCGYQLEERSASLPDWIQSIYVTPWENRSNELLLGAWITEELRQEFLRGSGLALAPKDEADVILEGEVIEVRTSGLSYVRYDQTVERRIVAECKVRLLDPKSKKVLWQTANIVREESFLVGTDVMKTEGLKNEALKKLSRDVAELVYHRITGIF